MAVPIWFILLATLGAVHVAAAVFRLIAVLSSGLRRPPPRRSGEWAVVTGPTSGIGRAMALELAARGLDVVLVGRDRAKLREVADAVTRSHGVRTKTVVFDFSLVSTVQGAHDAKLECHPDAFLISEKSDKYLHLILPKGAINDYLLNLAGPEDRYVAEFSRGLSVEYKSKGIDVQCQVPFLVDTKMISAAVRGKYVPLVVTAEEYARAAARSIGDGRRVCVPNTAHRLQQLLLRCTPEFAVDWCLLRLHLHHRAVFRAIRSSSGRRYSSTHRTPDGGQPATN
uniref:Very-long-chain 3-oxoacyl-CoA reductase n=1 Tax=Oryza brachyantha TaxID=4533 RepID=J3MDG3_ORYBR